jgi:hypothetical protein
MIKNIEIKFVSSSKHFEFFVGGKKRETFLSKFLNERMQLHENPSKKGTPRGEPIGFSMKKLAATLMMLTSFKQKDIAKILQVPFGTLRNWNSEKTFSDLGYKIANEFSHILVAHVLEKVAEGKTEEMDFTELLDKSIYSEILKRFVDFDITGLWSDGKTELVSIFFTYKIILNKPFQMAALIKSRERSFDEKREHFTKADGMLWDIFFRILKEQFLEEG